VIYAKLDVCFWRHKKFRRAGVAAAGYWAAALAYLREDDSDDGFLPGDVVGQLLGVTEAEGRAFCQVLVQVGLFAARDDGYLLVGYTTKNESRKQIEARKAANARKVASWRAKARGGSDSVTDDVTSDVTGYSGHDVTRGAGPVTSSDANLVTLPPCTGSGSGSGSDSGLRSGSDARARAGAGTTRRLTGASDDIPTAGHGLTGMQVDAYSEGIRAVTGVPHESGPFEAKAIGDRTKLADGLAAGAKTRGGSDPVTGNVTGNVTGHRSHDVTLMDARVTSSEETVVTLPACTGSGSGSGSDSDLRSGSDARARAGEVTSLRLAPRAADITPTATGHGLMGMQVDAYGEAGRSRSCACCCSARGDDRGAGRSGLPRRPGHARGKGDLHGRNPRARLRCVCRDRDPGRHGGLLHAVLQPCGRGVLRVSEEGAQAHRRCGTTWKRRCVSPRAVLPSRVSWTDALSTHSAAQPPGCGWHRAGREGRRGRSRRAQAAGFRARHYAQVPASTRARIDSPGALSALKTLGLNVARSSL